MRITKHLFLNQPQSYEKTAEISWRIEEEKIYNQNAICDSFYTFVANIMQMNDLQTYTEAVRVIKEAILRSQYRAASSANKEQLSLYYGIGCYSV